MIKVAMIGAGSVVFSKNLTGDILSLSRVQGRHVHLHGHRRRAAAKSAPICAAKSAKRSARIPTIEATQDRREALARRRFRHQHGADRRVRLDARRFRNPPQIRPELHHRRHHRAGRLVPRAAHLSDAHGPVRGHDGALPESDAAQLLQPDEHEHADRSRAQANIPRGRACATACRARSTSSWATSAKTRARSRSSAPASTTWRFTSRSRRTASISIRACSRRWTTRRSTTPTRCASS